ncbi:MAG: UDP-N-acetylglucosamine 2-epimerase [Desulforegulaceae bacterium]|nr:UDP-N-acetylglucosamine 2-epimerase [Desulforegulaceae bacterium]
MKKKILAVTGIRSEYDILYPVLKELEKRDSFDLQLLVSGAHLSKWHGSTLELIEKDGFDIADKVDSLFMTDRLTQRPKAVANLINGISQTVERENPDILLFVGDREESMATCIVGNYMDKLVAHLGGGDPVFGNADDPVRTSCSRLAHIHFCFAEEYKKNLINSGEEPFRVFFSGNPALCNIDSVPVLSCNEISDYLNFEIEKEKYFVVLNHPLSSEVDDSYEQMKCIAQSVCEVADSDGLKVVGIYPNTDPGSYGVIKAIDEIRSNSVSFFRNLPRDIFINLMRNSLCLVGNSSMGILEAPHYKLPVVNAGNRQKGRLNAGNLVFVDYNKDAIVKEIRKSCFNNEYRAYIHSLQNPYGNGKAHMKIADILENINVSDRKWHIKKNFFP